MRTTLNIDDDVLHAIKERARRESRTAGEVLSSIVREALVKGSQYDEIAEGGSFYGFDPLPRRGPIVSNELIDRLRDEEP